MTHRGAHRTAVRIAWVDVAKAASVVLVVLLHASLLLRNLLPESAAASAWMQLAVALEPLRMPMFFLTSGLLAASAVHRPWGQVRGRTWGMLYLAAVWMTLLFLLLMVSPDGRGLVATVIGARAGYWYLVALAAYFCVAVLTRRAPTWPVLALAAALNLLAPQLEVASHQPGLGTWLHGLAVPAIAMNLVFFLAGVRLPSVVIRYAGHSSWRWALPLALVAAVVAWGWRTHLPQQPYLVPSLLWILAGTQLAACVSRFAVAARAGLWLGARTLPVFVMQFPLLAAAGAVLFRVRPGMSVALVQWCFPVVVTVVVVAVALLAHRIARGRPWCYLFQPPPSLASTSRTRAPVALLDPAVSAEAELARNRSKEHEPTS